MFRVAKNYSENTATLFANTDIVYSQILRNTKEKVCINTLIDMPPNKQIKEAFIYKMYNFSGDLYTYAFHNTFKREKTIATFTRY